MATFPLAHTFSCDLSHLTDLHYDVSTCCAFYNQCLKGSTKTRFKIHDPYNPYGPPNVASFPNMEGLFRTAFRTISHSWMLEITVISFHLQFLVQFVPIEEDRKRPSLPRLHWPIFCVQDVKIQLLAACIIEAVKSTSAQL